MIGRVTRCLISAFDSAMFHVWQILPTEELAARARPYAHTDLFIFVRQLLRRLPAAHRPRDAQTCAHARRLRRPHHFRRRIFLASKNLFDIWKQ